MSLQEKIRKYLKSQGGHVTFKDLKKFVGKPKVEINQSLRKLSKQNLVQRINPGESPPIWKSLEVAEDSEDEDASDAADSSVETLVLVDTGGYPNLYLPLAKCAIDDDQMMILAPLDNQTNPKGISESSKPAERRIIERALSTNRFKSPRSAEMTPEYADVMLASLAAMFLSRHKVKSCVVIGKDRHNFALIKVIEELFGVKCESVVSEEEALEILS